MESQHPGISVLGMRNLGGDLDLPCPFSWLRNGGPLRGQRGSDHSEQSRDLSVGFLLLGQPARISLVQQSPQDTGLHLAHAWLMPGSCLALGTQTWTCRSLCLGAVTVRDGWKMGVETSDRVWDGVCLGPERRGLARLHGGGDVQAMSVLACGCI